MVTTITIRGEDMPEDVVFHILLWLPVVSLLRFKSVCKSWRSLIESSGFITQHLHHPTQPPHDYQEEENRILVGPINSSTSSISFFSLFGDTFQAYQDLDIQHHRFVDRDTPRVIASFNGLICLHVNHDMDVALWNPATKQFRVLPKSSIPLPKSDSHVSFRFGFGFDLKTNDYKVVRVIKEYAYDDEFTEKHNRVDVYELSTDSWRTIDAVSHVHLMFSDPGAPFRNGFYCWLGRLYVVENGFQIHISIVSFDFSNEVFGAMALPDVYSINSECSLILVLLRENIGLIDWKYEAREMENWHCKIWVLNEYGVKESWTKLYTIQLETPAFTVGLSNNGKIIYKTADPVTHEVKLLRLCDPVTQEIIIPPVHSSVPFDVWVVSYKESLVSIKSAIDATSRETFTMYVYMESEDQKKLFGMITGNQKLARAGGQPKRTLMQIFRQLYRSDFSNPGKLSSLSRLDPRATYL